MLPQRYLCSFFHCFLFTLFHLFINVYFACVFILCVCIHILCIKCEFDVVAALIVTCPFKYLLSAVSFLIANSIPFKFNVVYYQWLNFVLFRTLKFHEYGSAIKICSICIMTIMYSTFLAGSFFCFSTRERNIWWKTKPIE